MKSVERRSAGRVAAALLVRWGLPVAVLVLAFIGYVSYQGLQRQLAEARWVEHTHTVLTNLESVVSLLKDAETGARGYVITGEERYLDPYIKALNEIHGELRLLRNLLAGHPAQQQRMSLLESLAASRLIELDAVIEGKRESAAKGVEQVRKGRGKLYMDEIRALSAEMQREEEGLLAQRTAQAQTSADLTLRLIMFGTVVSLIVVMAAFFALRRENARRIEAQRMAQQRADEIEDLYNRAPCGYHSLDKDGVIVQINDTELEWLGYAREEIVGRKKFPELLTPESAARFAESFPRFRQTGRIDDIEFDIVRRDGTLLAVSLSAAAVRDADGNYLYSRSTLFDISERRLAQRGEREATAFLDSIVENIPAMIFVKDARDLKFVRLNRAGEELLGFSRSDLVGKSDYDFFPREEADFFTVKDREVLAGGRLTDIPEEHVHTRFRGTRILHTMKIPVHDGEGHARYLLGISEDITERHLAERRKLTQHAVTQVLAEASTFEEAAPRILEAICKGMHWQIGTVWRVDSGADVLRCAHIWNASQMDISRFEAFTRHKTFTRDQGMPGRVWASASPFWVSNDSADPNYPRGIIAMEYGLRGAFGFPIRMDQHVLGVIDFFSRELFEPDEDLLVVFSAIGSQVGQFIERKRAEAAVRQSEEDMRFLHSVTLEISQSEDSRAAFAALLRKVCDFTGWAYGQVWMPGADGSRLELSPTWYGRTAGLERFRLANEQLVSAPKTGLLVQVWTSKEPSWVWDLAPSPQHQRRALILEAGFRSWMGFPVLAGNDVIAVIEFFEVEQCQRDERLLRLIFLLMAQLGPVIQRKRVAEEIDALNANLNRHAARLEAANRELESFSYSVSHDLRSPLRAIDGFARILKEDYGAVLDSEGGRLLGVIINSSQKMGRLIDDLLDFSRLGRKPLAISRVDMTALAAEVLQQIEQAHGQPRPRVVLNAMPAAQCDPALIRQAWANLLGNAIKFSAKSDAPVVEVAGYSNGSDQIYCVKDNGAGFDMQYYDKLFGVFQRLHSEEEFPGTGVGLAIVQRVVSRHGGRVWAEGEVGKGATFYFSLPKAEADSFLAGASTHAQGNA